jgi:hypothetical protein
MNMTLVDEFRLVVMGWFLRTAFAVCPKNAIKTIKWFTLFPIEEL